MRRMTAQEEAVWFALRVGAANARPLREIALDAGVSRRMAERAIESLRTELHEPICASTEEPAGYFEAATPEDVQDYLERFNHRLATMEATRTGLLEALRDMVAAREEVSRARRLRAVA